MDMLKLVYSQIFKNRIKKWVKYKQNQEMICKFITRQTDKTGFSRT